MTSTLTKIREAIEASRSDSKIIITETIKNNNTSNLFVSGVMDMNALKKWEEVFLSSSQWFSFQFEDDFGDIICPSQAIPNSKNNINIILDNDISSPYILTPEGWKQFLFCDIQVNKVNAVHLAFINTNFKTLSYEICTWSNEPVIQEKTNSQHKKISARSVVRYNAYEFLPPDDISPWILDSLAPDDNIAFDIWKPIANRETLKCLPNELLLADNSIVKLTGKPPKKITFGDFNFCTNEFEIIQSAAKWVYFEGEEIELKHTFLSNELAREWPDGVSFCEGIGSRLVPAVDSARLLYKAHIRTSSKETLKALADLRKNLADDMLKTIQQSKELSSTLWKDVALVISTIIIKYTIDAAKLPSFSKTYSFIFFTVAAYIIISHFISISINSNFIKIMEENRQCWRNKLYGYLDNDDYDKLATIPIEKANRNYCRIRNVVTLIIIIMSITLIYLGLCEFIDMKVYFQKLLSNLNIIMEKYSIVMANFNSPPLFMIYW